MAWVFWPAAVATELMTALLVWNFTETARRLTRSKTSKQDRLFYSGVCLAYLALSSFSVGLSVLANYAEFGGWLLAAAFPTLSIASAFTGGVADAVRRRETATAEGKATADRDKKKRQKAKAEEQELSRRLSRLGKAGATLRLLAASPTKAQSQIAQELSISRQAVAQHLSRLEQAGAIERNNGDGVRVLWPLDRLSNM